MKISETFCGYKLVYISGRSIANNQYPPEKEKLHIGRVYTHSLAENVSPLDTKDKMVAVLEKYHGEGGVDLSQQSFWQTVPWKERRKINSLHLFGFSVSFTDLNDMEIPDYIVPPKDMVSQYYGRLLASDKPLLLHEQFDQALSIVGPYPTAASILLMFASRAIARDQETKILGQNVLDPETLDNLQFKVAGFRELWVENEPPDVTGNTYYFWTNVGMNMLLRANRFTDIVNDIPSLLLFPHGAKIMEWARRYKAKQPNPVSHKLPSRYGLVIGRSLANAYLS